MGIKDWAPSRLPALMTEEEHLRLADIKTRYEGDAKDQVSEDVVWLWRLVKRLSTLSQDEFGFPQYVALINPVASSAFAMRFHGQERIVQTSILPEMTVEVDLLDKTTSCEVCDAIMVVRPYIRLHRETKPGTVEDFRKALFSFFADGGTLVNRISVDEILILPNGTSARRVPWSFPEVLPPAVFPAGVLDEQHQASREVQFGFMASNGTQIKMRLDPANAQLKEPVQVVSGLVAARYTTKVVN